VLGAKFGPYADSVGWGVWFFYSSTWNVGIVAQLMTAAF